MTIASALSCVSIARFKQIGASSARYAAVAGAALALAGCSIFEGDSNADRLPGERLPVLVFEQELSADPALSAQPVVLPPPYVNPNWPQPGGYASNAMYHLEATGNLDQLWSRDAGQGSGGQGRIVAPPIVANGRVYVMDAANKVRAFDAESGDELWEAELAPDDEQDDAARGGGITYDNNRIFAVTGFGTAHALSAEDGSLLWTESLGDPFRSAPTAANGRFFAITSDNQTLAFAQNDGRVLWREQAIAEPAAVLTSPSPAISGNVLVAPFSSGEVVAMRVDNGSILWSDSLTRTGNMTALTELSDIAGSPVIDRDLVFAISHSGRMVGINLRTGARAWTRDIGGVQTPWVAGDYIFIVTADQEVVCLRRNDGAVRWLTELPKFEDPDDREDPIEWSGPMLLGDRLILVSSEEQAVSLSPYTGEMLGAIDLPDPVFLPPIAANGTMYVLTDDARLVAFR